MSATVWMARSAARIAVPHLGTGLSSVVLNCAGHSGHGKTDASNLLERGKERERAT